MIIKLILPLIVLILWFQNTNGQILTKITEFMHPQRTMPTAVAAMKLVENTDALIIDLRGNGGGYPGIMEYILNHYFDGPPTLLSTTFFGDSTLHPAPKYTSDLVYGKLRLGTPLYKQRPIGNKEAFNLIIQRMRKMRKIKVWK